MGTRAIGVNALRLRKNLGLTQEQVARRVGISRNAYRSVEKGSSVPRAETLRSLARTLKVPVRELVVPIKELTHVRFRSLKRLKRRDQVLAEVSRWLQGYTDLEEILGLRESGVLASLCRGVDEVRGNGPAAVAARVRQQLDIEPDRPVNDICGLLEARGVKVHTVQVESDAFLGLSVAEEDGGPAVVVNTWSRLAVEHWIFSAAHELAHLLLHLDAFDVRKTEEERSEEQEANAFASHFLMPDEAFVKKWDETSGLAMVDRVLKVKRVFKVSWRTVLYRLAEAEGPAERGKLWASFVAQYRRLRGVKLKKLDEPDGVERAIFRDPRVSPQTSQEPFGLTDHDFSSTRLYRLVRKAVEAEEISLSRAAEILGISTAKMHDLSGSWVDD